MEQFNSIIVNKFLKLFGYLNQTKNSFEIVSDEIEDRNLKIALDGLSGESLQYVNELNSQLNAVGISWTANLLHTDETLADEAPEITAIERNDELMLLCTSSESRITNAYREILNNHLPFPAIKELMTLQLNALKHSFIKIRMLNVSRYTLTTQ